MGGEIHRKRAVALGGNNRRTWGSKWADGVVVEDGEITISSCRFTKAVKDTATARGGCGLRVCGRRGDRGEVVSAIETAGTASR